jgi:hypothetical protein
LFVNDSDIEVREINSSMPKVNEVPSKSKESDMISKSILRKHTSWLEKYSGN